MIRSPSCPLALLIDCTPTVACNISNVCPEVPAMNHQVHAGLAHLLVRSVTAAGASAYARLLPLASGTRSTTKYPPALLLSYLSRPPVFITHHSESVDVSI